MMVDLESLLHWQDVMKAQRVASAMLAVCTWDDGREPEGVREEVAQILVLAAHRERLLNIWLSQKAREWRRQSLPFAVVATPEQREAMESMLGLHARKEE